MKRKFTSMACGFAAASILSLALTACDSDSPSAPTGGDEKSSAVESSSPSSSETNGSPESSSDAGDVSSSSEGATVTCDALSPECGYTEEELCNMGQMRYCKIVPASSSSAEKRCEAFLPECGYAEEELCGMGYTEYCASSSSTKQPETCEHITDYDGMSAEGNCVGRTGDVVTDCVTGQQFKCVDNFWEAKNNVCPPGSDCDGDGIPDGIRRPDLEPCDTDTLLEFYGRAYQCVNNKWVYLPAPGEKIVESASDVSAMHRGGPAVAPSVVKVETASGAVTFRDDGVFVDDNCTFNGLSAELRGDTLFATILYPGCTTNGGSMGVITFTLSGVFADVKYIKYDDRDNVKPVREADELLPCGNTSSCNSCSGDRDPGDVGC